MHSKITQIWDEILLQIPDRLTDIDSWHGHIPFAFWCLARLKPRLVVELGTHKGDSYCAFCQAVEYSKTATSCYAVDNWKGDAQSGFYGEDVYEDLCQYHNPRYGHFSTLLRATFEEALASFADGSIDLLHVDGLHTYEAVRADYESWKSKLSERAIVLFHDTNVQQEDFGVGRLWEEISRDRPHFSFLHSHGLGVLASGPEVPKAFRELLACDPEAVRFLFARSAGLSGAAVSSQRQLREIESLKNKVEEHEEQKKQYEAKVAEQLYQIRSLSDQLHELAALRDALHEARQTLAQHQAVLAGVVSSRSWQITAPLRGVAAVLRYAKQEWSLPGGKSLYQLTRIAARALPGPASGDALRAEGDLGTNAPERTRHDNRQNFLALNTFQLRLFLESGSALKFPAEKPPKVSILLVLHNQAALTYACLRSILETVQLPYEVVIVDNASTDETPRLLSRLEHVKIVRNSTNRHFLAACNQAVQHLRGEYLLFLNNDACLTPSALQAAVHTLETTKGAGAVGGRIVNLDGRLQEAGSIVWQDGSCLGYGRGESPSAPEYMFRREVDFCSGAFLLTRTELFARFNGFDPVYEPAYYEDADFCLRLRELGYRVIYEPDATIVHYEYGSSSSDQAVSLMTRNQSIFRTKHADVLQQRPQVAPGNIPFARYADLSRPRVLYIDDWIPHPHLGAGFPRSNAVVHAMVRAGANVTVFPTFYLAQTWESAYRDLPREVELILGATADQLSDFLSARSGVYNMLWVSRPPNMRVVRQIQEKSPDLFRGLRVVYDAEAIFVIREQTSAALRGEHWPQALVEKKIAAELQLAETADSIVSVSAAESEHFRKVFSDKRIAVLGHAMSPSPTASSFEERNDVLFVGAMYDRGSPNADSILWFCREIWPVVLSGLNGQSRPNLAIVGPNRVQQISELAGEQIKVWGQQPSLRHFYEQARVFIAPTRFAAGLPWKVGEAAAHGVPVVASGLVARQLGWTHEKQLLVAETPEEFAHCCLRLLSDKDLWLDIRTRALQAVEEEYGEANFNSVIAAELAQTEDSFATTASRLSVA